MPSFAPIASIPIASGPTSVYSTDIPVVVNPSACFGYTTAGDVISGALKLILVEAADSGLEPDEYADGLIALNDFMAGLESDGLRLGYSRCCNIADIVTIPDGSIRAVKSNLAIDLAPQFGGKVSATLIKQASEGMNTLRKIGVRIGQSLLPPSLPMGIGNYRYSNYCTESPYAEMTLSNNRRVTEITTEAAAEKAQGFWTIGKFSGLSPDISGRIINNGPKRTFQLSADLTLVADDDILECVVGFVRNAQFVLYTTLELSTDAARAVIEGSVELEQGQYLDIVVADVYTTTDVTLTDGVVKLW
jgi:hypothetical protein